MFLHIANNIIANPLQQLTKNKDKQIVTISITPISYGISPMLSTKSPKIVKFFLKQYSRYDTSMSQAVYSPLSSRRS